MLSKRIQKYGLFPAAALLAASLLLSDCTHLPATLSPAPTLAQPTRSGQLPPFIFSTQPVTATPHILPSSTIQPTVTATPQTHIVKKGDSLFGIALQYGVAYEALLAANPDINPNIMSIGAVIIIPSTDQALVATDGAPTFAPSSTALPVQVGPVECSPTREGGLWCVQVVTNPQDTALESVTALIRLSDPGSQSVLELPASLPLDRLMPGQSLPLSAYFPPPNPQSYTVSAPLITALPNPDDGRYLAVHIEKQTVEIAEDGLSAAITAQIALDQPQASAGVIRVAAVAYDPSGHVIGLRRWQNTNDQTIQAGQMLPITLSIYSASARITQVMLAVEARP
jgi:hypothetical protein